MDIFHELLEIKDIVEGPAKGGAGEGEPHRVERAVQDDPVHLLIKDDISHFDHFISTRWPSAWQMAVACEAIPVPIECP